MMQSPIRRRRFLQAAAVMTGAATIPLGKVLARTKNELTPVKLPPPIGTSERLQRLSKAKALMARHGIGSVIVESGSSLDYLTGVQWHRSERLTAAVIPAQGDPIIVTPFFERPSVAETLAVPAEIRTWNEDEEPLKLVADFLHERGVAGEPIGFEETDRYFIFDRLAQQLPGLKAVSANSVVRALRLIKSAAELALMQVANDITLQAMRHAWEEAKFGMSPAQFSAAIDAFTTALGG
ncbi:MAG TPA: aminopeptidase P family N-terminal domain-containing protein, partial [Sphingomicrobium sp.]|nr:aminopeptidase P family N-terminal domain-containing protein [Sphingomicrobium sp.]